MKLFNRKAIADTAPAAEASGDDPVKIDEGRDVFAVFPINRWCSAGEIADLVASNVAAGLLPNVPRTFGEQLADLARIDALHIAENV